MLTDLQVLISGATWFARCGQFIGEPGAVPFAAVRSNSDWDWLPTTRNEPDPVHGVALVVEAEAAGQGSVRREAERAVARWVLFALRTVPESVPALKDGPHDFTLAARGSALFAARMAAREAVVGRPGFWWRVMRLFGAGYWPCGRIREGASLVVL